MKQSERYAVTGGIGSGKSLFLGFVREAGIPVFSCDKISHGLWEDGEFLRGVSALFPACVKDGVPDRRRVSELVFSEISARRALEALSHPLIMKKLFEETDSVPVSFSEVPLLFEGGFAKDFKKIVVLSRDLDTRVRAVAARDGLSEEAIFARVRAQYGDAGRRGDNCCYLENNGSASALRKKTLALLKDWNLI